MKTPRIELLAATTLLLCLVLVAASVAWYGQVADPGVGEPGTVVVNLTGVGSSGVWTLGEVHGLNYWWKTFEPATIHLREGDEVVLNLRSADLFHTFYVPALGIGPLDVEPGHRKTVRFRVGEAGVHQYYCTSMCGTCHFYMRGWIVVTPQGEEPVTPPPILCGFCLPDDVAAAQERAIRESDDLVELGGLLYLHEGCSTCHGPEARGGIPNPNSAMAEPPAHDTTAQKLFLASQEDADALIRLLETEPDLAAVEDASDIARFGIVRTRYLNAEEIVRRGRYTAPLDPEGPEPPLQMPAWQHLLGEREIDALLAYFLSLQDWEEG